VTWGTRLVCVAVTGAAGHVIVALAGCGDQIPGEDRLGGATTVDDRTDFAFTHPATNLDDDGRATFQAGRGPFDFHWEVPALGPLFNNDACLGCHGFNGRGLSQIGPDDPPSLPVSQALIRVSLATGTPAAPGGPIPVPVLGLQLQDHTTSGVPEVVVTLAWIEHQEMYGDGETVMLRAPSLDIRVPTGGYLPSGVMTSYRQAPQIIGLGLLEAIDEADLRAQADPDDADGDGISGRVNDVWDPTLQATVMGRFGWKANTSTLRVQVAAAFVNDIGLTNKIFPEPDGRRDVNDDQLDQATFFTSTIAVPAAAPRSGKAWVGRGLFDDFGCSSCHVATYTTGDHAIAAVTHQTIHPYTDLLVHDMGDLLTDARPDFAASGREWRTTPLWGLGLAQIVQPAVTFMHDGRARTFAEAILWHGGEAETAREAFRTASKADRDALIAFLTTL
jgi:CxxC motif-containing protein (DUF1111 family)